METTGRFPLRAALGMVVLASTCLGGVRPVSGEEASTLRPDAFVALLGAGPLEVGALVARVGDDLVLQRLAAGSDAASALVAISGTPFLRCPEAALEPLAALAAGRDPDLAEAATRRAREIAQALALEGLQPRELTAASLGPARAGLEAVALGASVRPDLRQLAAEAAYLLGTLGVAPAAGQ